MKKIDKIYINDTLTQSKKEISFIDFYENDFNMYVCGITPYDYAHIGHARCYITYDILLRLLQFFGARVKYIQNITDVNDKINQKSIEKFGSADKYLDIASYYFNNFFECYTKIGCIAPNSYIKVSDSMPAIIHFIENIIKKGLAYQTIDGVYFNTKKYIQYGALSKRELDKSTISRISNIEYDRNNNYDFALWKNQDYSPFWESPWGKGVPGWHIECSSIIKENFNGIGSINLHGGGKDLIFPHHENEKAQSECCQNYPLSNIWMHVAFINFNKEKMSKSLGNSIYIKDILNDIDPMVFRFYLLTHHYLSPIEFNYTTVLNSEEAYSNLVDFFNDQQEVNNCTNLEDDNKILIEINECLADDLNTAKFIGLFFKYQKIIKHNYSLFYTIKSYFINILGLTLKPIKSRARGHNQNLKFNKEMEIYINSLIQKRNLARTQKNFILADQIKKELQELGIVIQDKKLIDEQQ